MSAIISRLKNISIATRIVLGAIVSAILILLCLNTIPGIAINHAYKNSMSRELREIAYLAVRYDGYIAKENERVIITDDSARVRYDSSIYDNLTGRYLLTNGVRKALEGEEFLRQIYNNTNIETYMAIPIDGGAAYMVKTDQEIVVRRNDLFRTMFVLSLALAALFVLFGYIFSRRITKRIENITIGVSQIKGGAFGEKIDIDGNDELTRLCEEINALSTQVLETENLRHTFVSDASHELRTPLSSIRLLVDSILQTDGIDMETTREFLNDIGEQIDRLTRIAERLLVLTRLDGARRLVLEPVNLKKVADTVVATLSAYAEEKKVELKCNLADDCNFYGTADGTYQIIFNLVENAIKYNNEGGCVRIYVFKREDECTLIVDDNGIGIPEEHYSHIFERFYRVDKARSRSDKGGSGLGLSIVAKTVENYGGTISVEPSVDGGTRFTVTFPSCEMEA